MESDKKGRRSIRVIAVLVLFGMVLFAATPRIIGNTSLRNTVLQSLVGNSNLETSSSGAAFGWFSPLTIDDFTLKSVNGDVDISVQRIRTQKSWLRLWFSSPNIGNIELESPRIEVMVDDGESQEETESTDDGGGSRRWPTISATITDGALLVREKLREEPVIDVDQVDIALHIEQRLSGSMLVVDPIELQREVLTPEVCDQGLQLVVPALSDEVSLEGEYSFELTKIHLSLGSNESDPGSDTTEIEGVVKLHHVSAGLKNDVTRRLAMLTADLMGLGEVPDRIRLTENAELAFHLKQGRVHHAGLAFVFPENLSEFSIQMAGSVGLDERIDLQILMQIPLSALNDSPLARQLSQTPMELRITGTIDQPKVGLPANQVWVSRLSGRLLSHDLSASEQKLADKIIDLLGDLLDETEGPPPQLSAPLLERVQEVSNSSPTN